MPPHTRRGAFGTMVWVCVDFVWGPRYIDCFVLAGVVRRIGVVGVSVGDSIKLGEVLLALALGAVGEMSCGSTGCLSCQGKQSTLLLLLLLLSLSGRSLLLILLDLLLGFSVTGVSVGDSIRLFLLGAGGEGGLWMSVVLEYHGGLGRIGIGSAMVVGVSNLEAT